MKDSQFDQGGSLMVTTRALLKDKDLLAIYDATGLSFYWLRKFMRGDIPNPSVNRVQYLYEHLSGNPLALKDPANAK